MHAGAAAATAVALMRSRYCAFVRKDSAYLLATWHVSTRPETLDLHADATQWLGLKIVAAYDDDAEHARVEFIARHRSGGGSAERLHEHSRFVREQGRWFYVDGELKNLSPR